MQGLIGRHIGRRALDVRRRKNLMASTLLDIGYQASDSRAQISNARRRIGRRASGVGRIYWVAVVSC